MDATAIITLWHCKNELMTTSILVFRLGGREQHAGDVLLGENIGTLVGSSTE